MERTEVVVVGGGLAGAAVAIRLAAAGRDVTVLERTVADRWRACGVFTATGLRHLRDLGVNHDGLLATAPATTEPADSSGLLPVATAEAGHVAAAIDGLTLIAPGGSRIRLTYGASAGGDGPASVGDGPASMGDGPISGSGGPAAVGFARPRLDALLRTRLATAGACLERGMSVIGMQRAPGGAIDLQVRDWTGTQQQLRADVLVGADGVHSAVARVAGAGAAASRARIGLTFHVRAASLGIAGGNEAWMVVLPGGYCGLAPVPGGLVNVGIVLDLATWRAPLRRRGAADLAVQLLRSSLGRVHSPHEAGGLADVPPWTKTPSGFDVATAGLWPVDAVAGAFPLAHRPRAIAGDGWLLVGDAAGFVDPFTGEGIGRAFVTAELAADAVDGWLRGDHAALTAYARAVRRRYRAQDRVTALVQRFLGHPALLDYAVRRLGSRPAERQRVELVLAERVPAESALQPRFLASVLRP